MATQFNLEMNSDRQTLELDDYHEKALYVLMDRANTTGAKDKDFIPFANPLEWFAPILSNVLDDYTKQVFGFVTPTDLGVLRKRFDVALDKGDQATINKLTDALKDVVL